MVQEETVPLVDQLWEDRKNGERIEEFNELMKKTEKNVIPVRKLFNFLPQMCRGNFDESLIEKLQALESEIHSQPDKPQKCSQKGVDTPGFNLGVTVPEGFKKLHSPSVFSRKHKEIFFRARDLLSEMFQQAFGKEKWYKLLYKELEKMVIEIHGEDAVEKIFPVPGAPFSAIWVSVKAERVDWHADRDSIGGLFCLTTRTYPGLVLQVRSDDGTTLLEQVCPLEGEILGGCWGLYHHKVHKLPTATAEGRPAIVFYFDRRILDDAYTIVDHHQDLL